MLFGCFKEKDKTKSNKYSKKDYISISKACDKGFMNACLDKTIIDDKNHPQKDIGQIYKKLYDEYGTSKAYKSYYGSFWDNKDYKSFVFLCSFGIPERCTHLGNWIFVDEKSYQQIKAISDDPQSDVFEKNYHKIAHFFKDERDKNKDASYFKDICRSGMAGSCLDIFVRFDPLSSRYKHCKASTVLDSFDIAKQKCEEDYRFCYEVLDNAYELDKTLEYIKKRCIPNDRRNRYKKTEGALEFLASLNPFADDTATKKSATVYKILAKNGMFTYKDFDRYLDDMNDTYLKNKKSTLSSLRRSCKLGVTTSCELASYLDDSIVRPATKKELIRYIKSNKPLAKIDTSLITDMSSLFCDKYRRSFKGIESWDVSKVENMKNMFCDSYSVRADLSKWNLSNVKNMRYILGEYGTYDFELNPLKLDDTTLAFWDLAFYEIVDIVDIYSEDVYIKKFKTILLKMASLGFDTKKYLAKTAKLDGGKISRDREFLLRLKDAYGGKSSFLDDLDKLVVPKSKEELIEHIRLGKAFDKIDTSLITDMSYLFKQSNIKDFSGIETWDVSNVVDMSGMFAGARYFNHDISKWNTKKVKTTQEMFTGATSFNQPIGSWDVSSLENAFVMFKEAKSFNQPLGQWNTTSLRNANGMFAHATSFNQNLSKWDISKVMELDFMFGGCKNFNQDLSKWDVKGKYFRDMLYDTPIQNEPKKHPKNYR